MGCSNSTSPLSESSTNESATLNVTIKSASTSNHFKNELLKVRLYSYDPMIADRSATLVEEITKNLNGQFKPFIYKTQIGNNAYIDQKMNYYLTVYVVDQQGKRTYYGYKNGTDGFSKVLENGNRDVVMILKPI